MKATPLLTGWTCRHLGDTAPGRPVTLPHDAMLAEPRTALSAGGVNTGWYEGYDYEYQRTLTVPENELSDTHIARNADQPNSRWYSGAGLYRPVQLWTAGEKHILLNGVRIRTVSLEPAVVEIRVRTSAPGTVRLMIEGLPSGQQESDGETVFTLTIDNARLWTPEIPNLYRCRVQFEDDDVTETFGVRTVGWGKNGFALNG